MGYQIPSNPIMFWLNSTTGPSDSAQCPNLSVRWSQLQSQGSLLQHLSELFRTQTAPRRPRHTTAVPGRYLGVASPSTGLW